MYRGVVYGMGWVSVRSTHIQIQLKLSAVLIPGREFFNPVSCHTLYLVPYHALYIDNMREHYISVVASNSFIMDGDSPPADSGLFESAIDVSRFFSIIFLKMSNNLVLIADECKR